MSRNAASAGPEFKIPDEILSVIPTDPFDQLDLARKITSRALASRLSSLETETFRMKQTINDKDGKMYELEEKLAVMQNALHDSESRVQSLIADNSNLLKERDTLSMTSRKLSRDLAKLESFKRQLVQSLNEDSSSPAVLMDIETCNQTVPKAYPVKDEETNSHRPPRSQHISADSCLTVDDASRKKSQISKTARVTPRPTPTRTPKILSTAVSPRSYSVAGSPRGSGLASPSKYKVENKSTLPWFSSSQLSSAASSPLKTRPHPGRTTQTDGKEFFRQARSRLTYEQFSAFLVNIKELNAQKQSREETLMKAREIFGLDNKGLYVSFQGLLNRKTH